MFFGESLSGMEGREKIGWVLTSRRWLKYLAASSQPPPNLSQWSGRESAPRAPLVRNTKQIREGFDQLSIEL